MIHHPECPCSNGAWGAYAKCTCAEISQRNHSEALLAHTEELRIARDSPPPVGDTSEGCGGGIHALVDRLQAEIKELRREREAIKDCLKMDLFAALAEIERIVYAGLPPLTAAEKSS